MEQGTVVSPCDWLHREIKASVTDPPHLDADPDPACHFDADPDPTFDFDPDSDLDPSFQIKAQNLEKEEKVPK
jgi:hypothetical protein